MSLPIIFESDGFPVELATEEDVRRAISSGHLKPATLVQHWEGEERSRASRARDVAFLQPLLGIDAQPPDPVPLRGETAQNDSSQTATQEADVVASGLGSAPINFVTETRPATPEHPTAPITQRSWSPPKKGFWAHALAPLARYGDANGRALRAEFWSFQLVQWVALIVLAAAPPLFILAGLGLIVPNVAVTIRRLHDINQSGWLTLLVLIPYLGAIVILVLALGEGTRGSNRFGHDPRIARERSF